MTTHIKPLVLVRKDPAGARYLAAYRETLREISQLEEAELLPINIDVPGAVTTTFGALPHIWALRERMANLSELNLEMIDRIERYALALSHAQGVYLSARMPRTALPAIAERARETRQRLLTDARALAQRGLLHPAALAGLRGTKAYRNVAFDITSLVALFRANWAELNGKTPVTTEELDQAAADADLLITATGRHQRAPRGSTEAHAIRQRMFTLFVRAYDEARRSITYLRWHEGDADQIAPSLYSGRRSARKASKKASSKKNDTPQTNPATA